MSTTWTVPTLLPHDQFRTAKAATTTDEAAPADPVKASATVAAAGGLTTGDTLVLAGITFTVSATLNTGLNVLNTGTAAEDSTNLAAAINRYTSTHGCTAAAVDTTTTITYGLYGTAGNDVTLAETGNSMTLGGALSGGKLGGGVNLPDVDNIGIDLRNVTGIALTVEAAVGAMTAGGKLKAYLYNPLTYHWIACPENDITVTALQKETYSGATVPAAFGRLAYLPNGIGRAAEIYLVGVVGKHVRV